MRILLDAHSPIWAVDDPSKLGPAAAAALANPANEPLLSAGTIWEIAIKTSLGKLTLSLPFKQWMNNAVTDLGATILPITIDYADAQVRLPHHHGDPFDRMLAAQALTEVIPIVSADTVLDSYGVTRLW